MKSKSLYTVNYAALRNDRNRVRDQILLHRSNFAQESLEHVGPFVLQFAVSV
jgi:hypothetical protein